MIIMFFNSYLINIIMCISNSEQFDKSFREISIFLGITKRASMMLKLAVILVVLTVASYNAVDAENGT